MYLAIIVLPLLGATVSGFLGRKIGVQGAQIITCSSVIITTLLSILVFIEVGLNNIPVSIQIFRWIDSESLNVLWGFYFDSLTVSMLIPVLIISLLVHIYSIEYMSHDPHNQRFFSYLSLFTFMMIVLVTSNNLLLLFVGWEGVGICSYLLISFWFTRIAANQSSMSALLTNRVGDCFLTIGIFIMLWSLGNIDYSTIFSLSPFLNKDIITIIGICLLIGAMAKSSQIGLHVWLPMAMEGPTPVSALIHAATMVTAGVYLLIRTSPLIEYSSTVLLLCLWIGSITTLFSSLIGLFQQDIKKVIAYSTMSQLGMMVIAVGLSNYNIALFHLVNHAFYKGLLFLGAGAVIHAVADNQDFRKYGGLKSFLPLTYSVMLIASLSLIAFPFMTGFYSKDFILESSYGQFYFSGIVIYFIATIGAIFTTLYSVKVIYLTFLSNPNGPMVNYKINIESNIYISFPLIFLAMFSIFFGYITKDIFIGLGSGFFIDNSIYIHPLHEITLSTEFAVPIFFKLLPLIFTIVFSILAIILNEFLPKLIICFKYTKFGYNLFGFFNQRFLIELFYNKFIINLILYLGGQTSKIIDKGSIELLGPFGLEKGLINLSKNIANLSTGNITSYALYILIGFILYILIPYLYLIDNSLLLLLLLGLFYVKREYLFLKLDLDKKSNFIHHNMQNNILILIKKINKKVFNKKNIITIISYSILIYIIRLCFIQFGIDIKLYYFFILLSRFFRDILRAIVDIYFDNNNMKLSINEDINNIYVNKNNKKLLNINTMCSDESNRDIEMLDAPAIDANSGSRSGSTTPTLSRETTPTPSSVAAAREINVAAKAALDSTWPNEIQSNNSNLGNSSNNNTDTSYTPMPMADAAQKIETIRALPSDKRIRNPFFSENPAPGTLTPEAEDQFYTEDEKKEHLINMLALRKEIYNVSPIAKKVNLNYLDKNPKLAELKQQEFELAERYYKGLYNINDSNIGYYKKCLSQLALANHACGGKHNTEELGQMLYVRGEYLKLNLAWSKTYSQMEIYQSRFSMLPEGTDNNNPNMI